MWSCSCGHSWNTFDTGGVCPACLYQWTSTQCLSCTRWSPHSDWYTHTARGSEAWIKLGRSGMIRFVEAQASIPRTASEHSVSLLQRGTLNVRLALSPPVRPSQLTQHEQDEVYVVMRGRGVLLHDGQRDSFESGDLLFVAAGTEHCFEDFTDDLAVWVVFYGPCGGEVPA